VCGCRRRMALELTRRRPGAGARVRGGGCWWRQAVVDDRGMRLQRDRRQHWIERARKLCRELNSFGRKKIDTVGLVFILLKCISSGSQSKPLLIDWTTYQQWL
jgi:hypothetical protein